MNDLADPLNGWPISEVVKYATDAKNDMYGSLYFLVWKYLLEFCIRIMDLNVSFELFHVDAAGLPKYVNKHDFDRIEVSTPSNLFSLILLICSLQISNIIGRSYLGPQICLEVFEPLLKQPI